MWEKAVHFTGLDTVSNLETNASYKEQKLNSIVATLKASFCRRGLRVLPSLPFAPNVGAYAPLLANVSPG